MKKTKLLVEHSYDFDLLGLITPVRDYKLAWIINNQMGINLEKEDDLEMEFLNAPILKISQYFLSLPYGYVQLLKNKSLTSAAQISYLIPELRNVDFFLIIQDETTELNADLFLEHLSREVHIQNVIKLNVNKIKSRENLLTY